MQSPDPHRFPLGNPFKTLLHGNMFADARRFLTHALTTLAVLLGMVSLGFGHHLKSGDVPLDPAVQAFLDAGGLLSDLCDEGTGDHSDRADCPMCQLAGGLMLPDPAAQSAPIGLQLSLAMWPQGDAHRVSHHFDAANSSRAPPHA